MSDIQTYTPARDSSLVIIPVPEYGNFRCRVHSADRVHVTIEPGIAVKGVLYPLSGVMLRHEQSWKFWGPTLQLPKVSPKVKEAILLTATGPLSDYLNEHPELFSAIEGIAWQKELDRLQYGYRQAQATTVRIQASIEHEHRSLLQAQELIPQWQEQIDEHLTKRPASMSVPDFSEERS